MRCLFALFVALFLGQSVFAATDDRGVALVSKNVDSRKRVALVIGNSKYPSSPLKNPVNDAKAMAAALRRLGFEVEEKTGVTRTANSQVPWESSSLVGDSPSGLHAEFAFSLSWIRLWRLTLFGKMNIAGGMYENSTSI